jgi:hypothetical protein
MIDSEVLERPALAASPAGAGRELSPFSPA